MKTYSDTPVTPHNGRTIAGIIILAIGGLLLIDQLDLSFIPDWLFSWPLILIAVGLYSGSRHNFKNLSWLIMVVVGLAFMLDNALPGLFIGHLIWPVAIISFGIFMIIRHSDHQKRNNRTINI